MRTRLFRALPFVAASLLCVSQSAAQSNDASLLHPSPLSRGELWPATVALDGASFRVVMQQAVNQKEPALAGILSFFIPGVGSFYAGNNTHGFVHLGIHVVSYGVMVGSVVDCANSLNSDCSSQGAGFTLGFLGLLVNDVWSIFSAVGDANAYNARSATPGRVIGSLYLRPEARSLALHTSPGVKQQVGLQILSWQR